MDEEKNGKTVHQFWKTLYVLVIYYGIPHVKKNLIGIISYVYPSTIQSGASVNSPYISVIDFY